MGRATLLLSGLDEGLDSYGVDCICVTNCVFGKTAEFLLGVSIGLLGVVGAGSEFVGAGSEFGVAGRSCDASCLVFDSDVFSRRWAELGIEGRGKQSEP